MNVRERRTPLCPQYESGRAAAMTYVASVAAGVGDIVYLVIAGARS